MKKYILALIILSIYIINIYLIEKNTAEIASPLGIVSIIPYIIGLILVIFPKKLIKLHGKANKIIVNNTPKMSRHTSDEFLNSIENDSNKFYNSKTIRIAGVCVLIIIIFLQVKLIISEV